MGTRLFGIIVTLWFFFALQSLFVALVLSPMGLRLLLPGANPTSWLYPALLVCPPFALLTQRLVGSRLSNALLWFFALVLGGMVALLFVFLGSLFFGH